MKRWMLAWLLLAGCSSAPPDPAQTLGFAVHFPQPPAEVKDGPRTEYQLHDPDFDYTAGVIQLETTEPLNGKTYQAELKRLNAQQASQRQTPFYGISHEIQARSGDKRALGWVSQTGEGRVLYAVVVQNRFNADRPLELQRVFQQFTEGAKL